MWLLNVCFYCLQKPFQLTFKKSSLDSISFSNYNPISLVSPWKSFPHASNHLSSYNLQNCVPSSFQFGSAQRQISMWLTTFYLLPVRAEVFLLPFFVLQWCTWCYLIHPSSAYFCYTVTCFILDSWVFFFFAVHLFLFVCLFLMSAKLFIAEYCNPVFPLHFLHIPSRPDLRHKEYFILALIHIYKKILFRTKVSAENKINNIKIN